MGAWIEIFTIEEFSYGEAVALLVGAWIEILAMCRKHLPDLVAPLVGAWIEIPENVSILDENVVAPLVGAWIEIVIFSPRQLWLDRRQRGDGKKKPLCGKREKRNIIPMGYQYRAGEMEFRRNDNHSKGRWKIEISVLDGRG